LAGSRAVKRTAVIAAAVLASAAFPAGAAAQTASELVQPEVRADVIASRWTSVEAGLGMTLPAGTYLRIGGTAAAGGGPLGFDSRLDLFGRFSPDPFRQSGWAPYAGGGLSERFTQRSAPRSRGYLLVFIGVEGPLSPRSSSGWVPALELGLGGGVRAGIAMRHAIAGRR
jgi:hypothetical protein